MKFQKCGLPHGHTVFILMFEDKLCDMHSNGQIMFAEILNKETTITPEINVCLIECEWVKFRGF